MNTRAFEPKTRFVPKSGRRHDHGPSPPASAPEAIVFDKAEEAESLAELEAQWEQAREIADGFEDRLGEEKDDARLEGVDAPRSVLRIDLGFVDAPPAPAELLL